MASSWRKLDPQDPGTYPESEARVLFVAMGALGDGILCLGEWDAKLERWFDVETDGCSDRLMSDPGEVTHWQPLPALPGEESERPKVETKPCPTCGLYMCGEGRLPLAEEQPKDEELSKRLEEAEGLLRDYRELPFPPSAEWCARLRDWAKRDDARRKI